MPVEVVPMNEGNPVPTVAMLLDEIDPESPFTTKISRAANEKLARLRVTSFWPFSIVVGALDQMI